MSTQFGFNRLGWLALCLLHVVLLVAGEPWLEHRAGHPHRRLVKKANERRQQMPAVVVTGIQQGSIQPRLEINQLQQNADQWNIYILGLLQFQKTDQSNTTSYYSIAGIHGRPYTPWDGVQPAPGITSPGYCNHVVNTFLTWHRPYLALFEQTLYGHMVDVVNTFPAGSTRDRYMSAISTWRTPYWDWAAARPAGQSVWPSFMETTTIEVITPAGNQTVRNPLFSYRFHPVNATAFVFAPFTSWTNTKRSPTPWNASGISENSKVASTLDNNRQSFQSRLYNLFVNYNNYTEFSNEAWESSSGVQNPDSLEALHDAIHGFVGLSGHMSFLDYSAFDPAFMLHHAMVDRAFALWQVLYPTSYVEPMMARDQTFTYVANTTITVSSPLKPFYSNSGYQFFNSITARNISTFGYTYPELSSNYTVASVKAAINKLYGSSSSGTAGGQVTISKATIDESTAGRVTPPGQTPEDPNAVQSGLLQQYTANIRSPKTAMNGSYAIYVFLGEFSSNPMDWPMDPALAGVQAVFAGLSQVDASTNSQTDPQAITLVSGSVPLTTRLIAKVSSGEIPDMKHATVEPYLKTNLHIRVAMFDGSEVAKADVPGLIVSLVSSQVQPASSPEQFPVSKNYTRFNKLEPSLQGHLGSYGSQP